MTPICAMNVTPPSLGRAGVWSTAWPRRPGFRPALACPARSRRRSGRGRRSGCSSQSRRRFGPMFTLDIAYEGHVGRSSPTRSWSSRSSPATRRSSTPARATEILRPLLGDHSLLLLDEAPHMQPAQAAAAALPRQADGSATTRRCARSPRAEIESWPTGEPYRLRPRMQAMTLEIILETVFGVHEGERLERAARRRCAAPRHAHRPADAASRCSLLGPERLRTFPPVPPPRSSRVDGLIYDEIAERRAGDDLRGARRHPLAAARRPATRTARR